MTIDQIADEVFVEITFKKMTVEKPTILVLSGLQYSGKSYLVDIITQHNYVHFWATTIKKQYGIKNPEMLQVATIVETLAIKHNYNIVIDFVNHTRLIRQLFQDVASGLRADYKAIYIDTPKEERLLRLEINIQQGDQPGRRVITLEQMQEFEDKFERPTTTENTITIKDKKETDDFIMSL